MMNNSVGMFNTFLTCHWFDDDAKAIWTDAKTLQGWLDVEAALATAQAELGMIPVAAAQIINLKADANLFDMKKISDGIKSTMHPLVPFLRQFEEICGEEAASYIHWGATTQNIIDAGAILQLRESHNLLMSGLNGTLTKLADLAAETKNVPMAGRTHGQQALPITFGFKVAAWHEEVKNHVKRINQASEDAFMINMGGAVGTFASMEGHGREVQNKIASMFNLSAPNVPVRTSCDSLSTYICMLGLMAATFEKIAREMIFLQRTEIAEAEEGFHYGKIGSSTMPQKRNPQQAMNIVGIAQLLRSRMALADMSMVRMNEGDATQENVMDVMLPEVAIFSVSLSKNMEKLISGVKVNSDKMLENLNVTRGMILSESVMLELARYIGRPSAHHAIYNATLACASKQISFEQAIQEELEEMGLADKFDVEHLSNLLSPDKYLGESVQCVEKELGGHIKL
ncbi:adenylosuccinate lyase family protein [Citrobacter portucalensis]|uniref:class-II fumarase/aspartase family protein n=1 Tax=Citrobacter portucalensis TaxID=1639133 RepID=UPI00226B9582|nr:adenylosuccinate lyase family protein [Citrobacter portucalensis]MCX8981089.1 adenylosuccinate lyase family protein [Citrobacter portucalensis]